MHLTPREIDKLMLHQAGVLAQKRLARGLRLNYVEAVALIADAAARVHSRRPIRWRELMDLGRSMLGRADVLDGVAEMIDEVQVEGTFPDGTKLVTVHHPIVAERGDRALALYRQLPRPRDRHGRGPGRATRCRRARPDDVIVRDGEIVLNEGRADDRARRSPTAATVPSRSAATITSSRPTARWSSTAAPPTACGSTFPPAPRCGSSPARRRR